MLELNQYFVKEHVGMFKMVDTFDIINPNNQQQVGVAREEPGGLVKTLRLVMSKKMLPNTIEVRKHPDGELVFTIRKPFTLFRDKIDVCDSANKRVGYFQSKLMSLTPGFWVYDDSDKLFAEIKGKWHGWDFKFVTAQGAEVGSVTKKWAGLAKELFTSADNYVVSVSKELANNPVAKMLLLGATLAIDVIFHENK